MRREALRDESSVGMHHTPDVHAFPPPVHFLRALLFAVTLIDLIDAGCYQPYQRDPARRRLCCAGRNHTCQAWDERRREGMRFPRDLSAMVDERDQSPSLVSLLSINEDNFPIVFEAKSRKKLGRLILHDTVELSTRGERVARRLGHREFPFRAYTARVPSRRRVKVGRRVTRIANNNEESDQLIFGVTQEDTPIPERILYHPASGRPLIRYSLLTKYLPLRLGKVKRGRPSPTPAAATTTAQPPKAPEPPQRGTLQIAYFTVTSPECYCDEQCLLYGDCCYDYAHVCPRAEHCAMSHWGGWGECQPVGDARCGEGQRSRERFVVRQPQHGGTSCPTELREAKACFVECSPSRDVDAYGRVIPGREGNDRTTVALLLDYKYHDSRRPPPDFANGTADWWWEMNVEKTRRLPLDAYRHYCVHYELGWVNRNCVERKWKSKLHKHALICAECQPEAQYHRQSAKCASELDDGERGFWKLIGPPSCNGVWRRIGREEECKCGEKFPNMTSFLLV